MDTSIQIKKLNKVQPAVQSTSAEPARKEALTEAQVRTASSCIPQSGKHYLR